ncbi:MAG: LacI family DNA-binding transcriptional regulator [Firmicutes bacterium]|nr:LacI family DNA-binding transcriptional regulator [Bacillota bacterium]
MATLRDVAARAGVGIATVSRALNGTGPVSEAVRRRVEEAAAAVGYVPNGVARGLVTGVTRTFALILPDITNPYFPSLARAVEDAARVRGYAVVLGNSDNDPDQEAAYVRLFRERGVDGMIIASSRDASALARVTGPVPVVLIDRRVPHWDVDCVVTDNRRGIADAVQHLAGLGHRRLVHLGGPEGVESASTRAQAFMDACRELGVEVVDLTRGPFTAESGYERGRRLLKSRRRFTAVVAANDLIACGFLQAAFEAGRAVPGDVSVTGFDDVLVARLANPPLTTVRQPTYRAGQLAVERLAARLDRPGEPVRVDVLKPELVVRSSSGPAR